MKRVLHPKLDKSWIDPFAVSIVERLQRKGFETYLVGGCVRDLLAGQKPKDFDIATSAKPEEIREVVDRAFIIGKRFRLVLVKRGADQFEVATFRKDPPPEESLNEDGLQVSDNVFGTPEEDARRRDFTVNAMFYDPIKDELLDYCEGLRDIEERTIRVIGDPTTRLTEDPIRILRALRLAHKVEFSIEPELKRAMVDKAPSINLSVLPRRREEMLKILKLKDPSLTLHEAHDLGILKHAFPGLDKVYLDSQSTDDFDSYLHRLKPKAPHGIGETTYLFGFLILAYMRAILHADPHRPLELTENQAHGLAEFMKKELGVFNLEESQILRALELQTELLKTDDYNRRGHRRKIGFLRNEALPLALYFAELDHVLSPTLLQFWQSEMSKVQSDPESQSRGHRRRPRRHGPRRSTGGEGTPSN